MWEEEMGKQETIFSFDIGWAFHGWGVKAKNGANSNHKCNLPVLTNT